MNVLIPDHIGPPLTRQQCFDRAWEWVKTHGPCVRPAGETVGAKCLYRNADNTNACLFGQLIPDSRYSSTMEGLSVSSLFGGDLFGLNDLFEDAVKHYDFVSSLQSCHDDLIINYVHKDDYQAEVTCRLRGLAATYNLVIPGEAASEV